MTQLWEESQKRRHQRIALEVEVLIVTNGAMLRGRTQDISESGMAAILPVELQEGAEVEVQIKLPAGIRTAHAIVRHRNVYSPSPDVWIPPRRSSTENSLPYFRNSGAVISRR